MHETDDPTELPAAGAFGPTVTIFFSDIRGFTEYTDVHGDAEAYRMLQHHNELVKEQIALYQGHIVKTLGDSYMVSFDAARNAITCAIGIQRQLSQYNATQQGPKIEIGIGINMGEPIREGDDLFGASVNLASRICGVAGAGRILVSEAIRQVVTRLDGGDYIDRGYFEIKGFAEPQHLYEVDWTGVSAIRATQVAPPRAAMPASEAAPEPVSRRTGVSRLAIGGGVAALLALAAAGTWMVSRGPGAAPASTVAKVDAAKPKDAVVSAGSPQPSPAPSGASGKPAAAASPVSSPQSQAAASPATSPAAGGATISQDRFDNPNQRKFRDSRSGTDRAPAPGQGLVEFDWDYRYDQGELVARIRGRWPPPVQRAIVGITMESTDRVQGDVAVEVSARAVQLADQTRYGLGLDYGGDDMLVFTAGPSDGTYLSGFGRRLESRQPLISGRSSAIRPGAQANQLRLEQRGGMLRYLINGQEVGQAPHPKPQLGPATVELYVTQVAPGPGPELEVRFDDYRVQTLAP